MATTPLRPPATPVAHSLAALALAARALAAPALVALIAAALLLAPACDLGRTSPAASDDAGAPDGGAGNGSLTVTPADPVLPVDGKAGASVTFKVMRGAEDLTAKATFGLFDPKQGGFAGATFTSAPGVIGKIYVRASVGNEFGQTSVTLKLTATVIAPNTPADAPTKFGGPVDAQHAPEPAYPPDGALVPPNLSVLEVQWKPAGYDLFEIALAGEALDLKLYVACQDGAACSLLPDEKTWNLLAAAARGKTSTLTLRGTSAKGGGPVGVAPARKLSFADENMEGGLYYWAASTGGVFRYDFGLRGQKAESFYDPVKAGGAMCVGCHTLSRDGKRITVGLNAPTPAPALRTLDVATRKVLFEVPGGFQGGSNFEALSPDGSRLVTSEGSGLLVRDATTGAVVGSNPALSKGTMPDFSPDGKQVVYARSDGGMPCFMSTCNLVSIMSGSIWVGLFNGTSFTGSKQLVPSGGANNYYPSFSPDGQLVVFNRSSDTSYDSATARVMLVRADGSGAPVELKAAGDPPGSSWPKWAPFIHHFGGATVEWITFSSRRPYGLRSPKSAQIWMVPVAVGAQQLGSVAYPAIWLPFQDFSTGNHIPQWVAKVERAPCSQVDQSGCAPGEMCVNGACQPGPQ